ncbi:MAG: hypothetical protein J07HX64_02058 [halophilic archaeon J07HX64]|jgi:hypothetical protein|nr:MAG: hypothetical protein J07HX64_02058 [halophilic archaeon J07HX64]
MDLSRSLSRRHLLASGTAVTLGALTGCVSDSDNGGDADSDDPGGGDDPDSDDGGDTDSDRESDADDDADRYDDSDNDSDADGDDDSRGRSEGLNLREANVVDVTVEEQSSGYRFDVALHHDDSGEEGYANWWQVERLDGTRLGRRELLHAHSRQPFTRSETVTIPDSVDCVVVRGHDQTHGYGGQVMLVSLESGETRALDKEPERGSFDERNCPTENPAR